MVLNFKTNKREDGTGSEQKAYALQLWAIQENIYYSIQTSFLALSAFLLAGGLWFLSEGVNSERILDCSIEGIILTCNLNLFLSISLFLSGLGVWSSFSWRLAIKSRGKAIYFCQALLWEIEKGFNVLEPFKTFEKFMNKSLKKKDKFLRNYLFEANIKPFTRRFMETLPIISIVMFSALIAAIILTILGL